MEISENLSSLNFERFKNLKLPFKTDSARQAIFSFLGDTYVGLDAGTLTQKDLKSSQNNIRILSGLYGLLRPMDIIMTYRLEMGTKLKTNRGTSLYDFWGDLISMLFIDELTSHEKKIIINCASVEYFKAVNMKTVKAEVVTPVFKELRNGKPRIISFFSKKARGAIARYIITNKISDIDGIISFDLDNYSYSESLSSKYETVFIRYSA
tara:strand:+ start:851 stop:1477 length:627 start_codon:yes stop_codon:yes gene_type:complete